MGVPYTGSGVLASALAMDKEASKKVFLYHNVPTPPFKIVTPEVLKVKAKKSLPPQPPLTKGGSRGGVVSSLITHHSLPDFKMPWVIKPATEGSSVGVEIVRSVAGLKGRPEKGLCVWGKSDRRKIYHRERGADRHIE